ncbi:MAG TPA: hypothetical protein VGA18_04700 [Rhodothermales bacterium]
MIRFLLVLLAFVSALLAFIFQETVLFVAAGGLLMVSVVLLLLQVREQSKRKNRLKMPNDLTPQDELRARGVLEVRPKAKTPKGAEGYAPPERFMPSTSSEELSRHGIVSVRQKTSDSSEAPEAPPVPPVEPTLDPVTEDTEALAGIPWSVLAEEDLPPALDLFVESAIVAGPEGHPTAGETFAEPAPLQAQEPVEVPETVFEAEAESEEVLPSDIAEFAEAGEPEKPVAENRGGESPVDYSPDDVTEQAAAPEDAGDAETQEYGPRETERRRTAHRRVEVDAHLPSLLTSLGAQTICLIDVDTDRCVYRLRSIVSSGSVDNAGTEYPFAGFFLSDLLAETTVIDVGPAGLAPQELRYHRDPFEIDQVIAAPVMKGGLPAAFLVAAFGGSVDESSQQAVTRAAALFSSLYALQDDHPSRGESPLARAKRKPPSLRLVKSNPQSSQSKIIAEEMSKARGKSYPMALALVCLDKGDEISRSDKVTVYQVEEWMRRCLEQITPDGRIEYLGELGYGIIQLRDVSDVEGWVRRAQQIFRSQHGPVDAHPIVGVAMLSEGHRDPEDLQADAVRALRAAYETGDSTILVG